MPGSDDTVLPPAVHDRIEDLEGKLDHFREVLAMWRDHLVPADQRGALGDAARLRWMSEGEMQPGPDDLLIAEVDYAISWATR